MGALACCAYENRDKVIQNKTIVIEGMQCDKIEETKLKDGSRIEPQNNENLLLKTNDKFEEDSKFQNQTIVIEGLRWDITGDTKQKDASRIETKSDSKFWGKNFGTSFKTKSNTITKTDIILLKQDSQPGTNYIDKCRSYAPTCSSLRLTIINRKKAYRLLPKLTEKNTNNLINDPISNPENSNSRQDISLCCSSGLLPEVNSVSQNVITQPPIVENRFSPIKRVILQFTDKQLKLIKEILIEDEIITDCMDDTTRNTIINCIYYIRLAPNVTIYSTESKDNIYYIIEKGRLEYMIDGEVKELARHDRIGTKALEKNSTNECYLKSKKKSYLFCLPIESYKNILSDFMIKEQNERINSVKAIPLFKNLEKRIQLLIANTTTKKTFHIKENIVTENSTIDCIYLISEGIIHCMKSEITVKKLKQGDIFGDIQLFCHCESLYSYWVEPETTLYEICHQDLVKILGEKYNKKIIFSLFSPAIKTSQLLRKHFSTDNLDPLFDAFHLKMYCNSQVYLNKQKKILMLIAGKIFKQTTDEVVSPLNRRKLLPEEEAAGIGEFFGERIIDSADKMDYCIITDECVVFEIAWNEVLKTIKCISSHNISLYDRVMAMKSHQLFKNLSEMKLFQLAECLKTVRFKDNDIILKDGPTSTQLFIIISGIVKIFINMAEVKTLEVGQTFGDISSQAGSYSRKASFVAKGNAMCYCLEKESFDEIIDCTILKPLKKILIMRDITVTLDNLYFLKELGCGSFGKVYLVHDTKRLYAMKTAEISKMFNNQTLTQFYLSEKSIMASLDHPFVVQMINTFKTRQFIFFMLQFLDGPTLKKYIENRPKEGLRNLCEVQFFGAILLCVVNYLQKKRIIHRDLKADNCIIDKNGYLKVLDFGIAKDLSGKDQTYTFIGTARYMAPEVILGKGYGFAVDYWSIGIILYELFFGIVPFGADAEDGMDIYREITEKKLVLPFDPKFKEFNNLLKQFLYKNPAKRISTFSKIKGHLFFKSFDFDSLIEMTIPPPFVPSNTLSDKLELLTTTVPFTKYIKENIYHSSHKVDDLTQDGEDFDFLSDF